MPGEVNATASSHWPWLIYLSPTDRLTDEMTESTLGVNVAFELKESERGCGGGFVPIKTQAERQRDFEQEATIERARELLACQGRSRISYAQEVGVIKIDMDCI